MLDPIIFIPVAAITGLALMLAFAVLVGRAIALGDIDDEAGAEHPPAAIYPIEFARARRDRGDVA